MQLELVKLSAGYGDKPVLRELDLKIADGSICALLGPNGSGKTTLLRNVNAIIKPLSGAVLMGGDDVLSMSRKEIALRMAYVPQSTVLPFNYTGLDMVVMGKAPYLGMWSSPGPADRKDAYAVMESMDIAHLSEKYYMQMSSGERQMVLLGRAVVQNSPLLLLDEPTSHLDLRNQCVIMRTVREIAASRGATVLITMHDPNLALRYCDHVALLHEGALLASGATEAVLTGDNLTRAYGVEIRCETTEGGSRVVVPTGDLKEL